MNGVGGRTIAEAKQRISFREFLSWAAYRAKRGSLNPGYANELMIARWMAIKFSSRDKQYQPYHFGPHIDEPELTPEMAEQLYGK